MITFFTAYLGGTHGTAKSARDFLRALLACHCSVRVVSPNREQFPSILCGKELSSPEWLDMPRGVRFPIMWQHFNFHGICEWLLDKKYISNLRKLKSQDVVIVNGWASCRNWKLVEDCFNGPKVIVIRESPRHFSGPDRVELFPELLGVFSCFDHLLFVSDRVCSEWRNHIELAKKPYYVVPNCCEEEEVMVYSGLERIMLRKQLGLKEDAFIVLCPGTIEHRKGQDMLLDVANELNSCIPNLCILIVGDPATKWGINLLESIPQNINDCMILHWPARKSIMELLRVSDVLAFPSRAEAMPRTILEAMAMKTPIVASDVDGIPELIEDGVTGFLFSCNDKEGLKNAIVRLYAEPALRKIVSECSSDRYWRHFSRRCQFDRMDQVLEDLTRSVSYNPICFNTK